MFKKVALALLGVVALFAAVLLVKTLTFTSVQLEPQEPHPLALDGDRAAQRLAKAVTFKTISHQIPWEFRGSAFTEFHAWLEEAYPEVHASLKRETVNDYSLLYEWPGSNPDLDPIYLLAHMDVVPVDEGSAQAWTHPPFDGVIEDGTVWGRGTLDDKSSVIAILEATEALLADGWAPKRTIFYCFGHDEEIGGTQGAKAMAELLIERGHHAWFSLDEGSGIVDGVLPGLDTPVGLIATGEKGYVSIELEVTGEGGHSSQPPPQTSIGILAQAITKLEANPMPARLAGPLAAMFNVIGREMSYPLKPILANLWLFEPLLVQQLAADPTTNAALRTTTAVTIMEAGTKENVLPIKARAVVNHRILPGDTVADVVAHVTNTIDDERVHIRPMTEHDQNEASPVSDITSDSYQALVQSIRNVHPDIPIGPGMSLGGTDSKHFYQAAQNCYRFQPFIFTSKALATIHGTDEHIAIDNFLKGIHVYTEILRNTAG